MTYWHRTLTVTLLLLVLWLVVSFVLPYFARDLQFRFFGWPFSFWMAAQGALIVYLIIIAFYAWYMNRLDASYGVGDVSAHDEPN